MQVWSLLWFNLITCIEAEMQFQSEMWFEIFENE